MLSEVQALGCSAKARTQLRLSFVPSPAQAAQAARSLRGALSPGAVRPLPSVSPAPVPTCALCIAATLPVDVNRLESQEVFG